MNALVYGKSMRIVYTLGIGGGLWLASCVPQGKYDDALKDAAQAHGDAVAARGDAQKLGGDLAAARAELERLRATLKEAEAHASEDDQALAKAGALGREQAAKLDGAIAENEQLRKELTRLGKNVDTFLAEKGSLATALADAKKRLEELRQAQAAAEARAALFKQLALKFHKMIDAGDLRVVLRRGHMVIQLANDVLFESGRTEIKPRGQDALRQVAAILRTLSDRHFQVAGDTDNVPIQTPLFPSNWELSTRRAVEVVHFLIAQGMRSDALSAAGYGEFDPVASNETADGRTRNRRIEITLEPNINELVSVPTTD
jgi:chemotaxis protein MotB